MTKNNQNIYYRALDEYFNPETNNQDYPAEGHQ